MSHRYDGPASRGGYGSPSATYRGHTEASSQPYSNRPMPPPPSSPQSRHRYNQSFPPPLPRDPQPSPAQPMMTGRDLPAPTSSARPGSSMSISSMLGSDTAPPHHTTPPSQTSTPVQPLQNGPIGSFRSDYAPYRHAKTPDSYPQSDRSVPRDFMGNSTSTSPSAYPPNRDSPDQQRQLTQPMYQYSHQSPYSSSATPDRQDPMRQAYPDRGPLPPRPNSQPIGQAPIPKGREGSQYTSYPPSQDRPDLTSRFDRRDVIEDRERAAEIERHRVELDRERDLTRNSQRSAGPSGVGQTYYKNPPYGQRDVNREPQWRQPGPYQSSPEGQPRDHTSLMSVNTMNNGPVNHQTPSGSISNSPTYPRSNGNAQDSPSVQQPLIPYPQDSRRDGRQHEHQLHQNFGPSLEEMHPMQRKGSEDSQRIQKGLLSVSPDITRKTGRISPLPQAVQGAQGQLHGPGREPGIKSEFGRMFSGIGSGVGSGLASPAPQTTDQEQSRSTGQQVFRQDQEVINLDSASQENDARLNKSGAKGSKPSRKFQDDESRLESESGEGRGGSINGRGTKRSRHAHHHHHHPPGHRHHHHHHKADDETLSTPNSSSPAFTAFSTNKHVQSPGQVNTMVTTPSGHHHHHHHHHHHAKPTSNSVQTPQPLRKPTITIRSSSVVGSVARLPRTHLGSTLYTPRLTIASSPSHQRFGFASSPTPLPRLEAFDNCTLTVRISREYLQPKNREEITRRRAVWGTEVYTDDSDVLAAAIHSGWVRGEWGSDVDISLLDLGSDESVSGPTQNGTSKPKSKFANPLDSHPITTLPPTPSVPSPEVDLHVTVLILPALKNYAATVQRGVRSRLWGSDHDGKSFKIQSIAWVDEGAERVSERTGQARRKRLKAMADFKSSHQPAEVLGGISRQVNAVGKVTA